MGERGVSKVGERQEGVESTGSSEVTTLAQEIEKNLPPPNRECRSYTISSMLLRT